MNGLHPPNEGFLPIICSYYQSRIHRARRGRPGGTPIAAAKPVLEILPLSIGAKSDPVRLIFDSNTGEARLTGFSFDVTPAQLQDFI
jgi:hypothetical protein